MKRNIFRVSLWCGICMAMTLVGCKADVDLGNIDTTTKVEANLALPIGSVNATLGDFVGDGGQFLRRDLEVPFVVILKDGELAGVSSRIGGGGGAIEMKFLGGKHLFFPFLHKIF